MRRSGYGFTEWALLLLLALIWGSSFILMKRGLEVYSPSQVASLRMFIAFLCLFPFVAHRFAEVPLADWKFISVSGVLGNGIPAFLFAIAQTKLSSSVAGILNSLVPLFTMIVAFVAFRKKILPEHLTGVLIGFAGAVMILVFRSGGGFEGNYGFGLMIVAATICYAFSINIIKNYLKGLPAMLISGFAVSVAGIPCGIYLFTTDFIHRFLNQPGAGLALLYVAVLSVFGTAVSLVLFNRLIKTSSVLFASSVTYLIPVVALIWGLSDHEQLGMVHLAGMMAILIGVYLVNRHPEDPIYDEKTVGKAFWLP